MSSRDSWKLNVVRYAVFEVFDPATGLPVPGIDPTTFTKAIFNNGGAPSVSPTITITELTLGRYLVTWTPNALGYWYLGIRHPTYNKQGVRDEITVVAAMLDDFLSIGSPLTQGVVNAVLASALVSNVVVAVLTTPVSTVEVAIRGVRCLGSVIQRIRNKVGRTGADSWAVYESGGSVVAWSTTTVRDPAQQPVITETPV